MTLDELVGGPALPYFGACNNTFFKLSHWVFEAVEDESDGYRSMLSEVKEVTDPELLENLTFLAAPVAFVTVESVSKEDDFEGYELQDDTLNVCWGEIGTNKHDDYYPSFHVTFNALDPTELYRRRHDDGVMHGSEFEAATAKRWSEYMTLRPKLAKKGWWDSTREPAVEPAVVEHPYSENPRWGSWS